MQISRFKLMLTHNHLSHFDKLEPEALPLQLLVGLGGLLVHQGQLRVLRPLEEVEVPGVVLRVVDSPCMGGWVFFLQERGGGERGQRHSINIYHEGKEEGSPPLAVMGRGGKTDSRGREEEEEGAP